MASGALSLHILAQEPDEDVTHADLLMRVQARFRGQLGGLGLVE